MKDVRKIVNIFLPTLEAFHILSVQTYRRHYYRLYHCRELAAQIADVVDSFLEELNSGIEDGKRYIKFKLCTSLGCTYLLC